MVGDSSNSLRANSNSFVAVVHVLAKRSRELKDSVGLLYLPGHIDPRVDSNT